MSRSLIDTRVGEYKSSFICVLTYSLVIFFACSCLFWLHITILEKEYSPVMFLLDNKFNKESITTYLPVAYTAYFVLLFMNLFLCLAFTKVRRSMYFKLSKIFGFILGLALVGFHGYLLLSNLEINRFNLVTFFYYGGMAEILMLLELLVYHHTKKISIYD